MFKRGDRVFDTHFNIEGKVICDNRKIYITEYKKGFIYKVKWFNNKQQKTNAHAPIVVKFNNNIIKFYESDGSNVIKVPGWFINCICLVKI